MRNLVLEIGPAGEIQDYGIMAMCQADEELCREVLARIQAAEKVPRRWIKHMVMVALGLDFISTEVASALFKSLDLRHV